jgi:ketosteroid isomerase-like protein
VGGYTMRAWCLLSKSTAYYNRDFDGIMDVYLKRADICIYDSPISYYGWNATAKMIRDFIEGSVWPMRIDYRSIVGKVSGDLAGSWQVAHIDTGLPNGQNVSLLAQRRGSSLFTSLIGHLA